MPSWKKGRRYMQFSSEGTWRGAVLGNGATFASRKTGLSGCAPNFFDPQVEAAAQKGA
jgi:hypothetical protein